jgi:ABC-type Fe3+/spermidine/putrescine transport system ATPase subunit
MSLEVETLRKSYPDFEIDMALSVGAGELVTLLGPSGCGKTTCLRLVAGLIRPDDARISLGGRRIDRLPTEEREIGIVFQDYALFPHMNVAENIAFGPSMKNWPRERIRERVRELLDLVQLAGYEARRVTELSGGEQQRVALARALAPSPRLLLLDEPLSALDARLRKSLRAEIRRIQQQLGLTTLYVTHDQEEALALSDRIVVMRGGRREQTGTPREIYHRPATPFVAGFIGPSNLLPGTLLEVKRRYGRVRTPLGDFPARLSARGRHLPPGAAVTLFFRPQSCRLAAGAGEAGMRLSGVISSREYLGEMIQLQVRVGKNLFLLKTAEENGHAPGEELAFSVSPRDCLLLPGLPP